MTDTQRLFTKTLGREMRSGGYRQTVGALRRTDKFCAVGVAVDVAVKQEPDGPMKWIGDVAFNTKTDTKSTSFVDVHFRGELVLYGALPMMLVDGQPSVTMKKYQRTYPGLFVNRETFNELRETYPGLDEFTIVNMPVTDHTGAEREVPFLQAPIMSLNDGPVMSFEHIGRLLEEHVAIIDELSGHTDPDTEILTMDELMERVTVDERETVTA